MRLDFFKGWINVSLHPWMSVFAEAVNRKSHIVTFLSITIASLFGLGLSRVIHILTGQNPNEFKGLVSAWVDSTTQPPFFSWSIIISFGVIVGFYDFQIVLLIFARLPGGKGSLGTQAYLQSLLYAPLVIIQQTLIVIPIVGFVLFILVAVYSLIPTTNSLKAAHEYSTKKAILTWLLPILLNISIIYLVTMILISRSPQ